MKGVAFLDVDGELGFRSQEFLDYEDPKFMTNNHTFILKAWRFDTDDINSMLDMFRCIRDMRLTTIPAATAFAKSIGFDLARLKENK